MLLCNGLTLGTEMSTHHFNTEVKDNFQNDAETAQNYEMH